MRWYSVDYATYAAMIGGIFFLGWVYQMSLIPLMLAGGIWYICGALDVYIRMNGD